MKMRSMKNLENKNPDRAKMRRCWRANPMFQSTRPTWGATTGAQGQHLPGCVSIHAPHVGRDSVLLGNGDWPEGFNPRAPRGARRDGNQRLATVGAFQSTRPTWGATAPGYLTDLPAHPRSPARTCRRRSPKLHTYRSAPPPTHSPHWRYPLPRTPTHSHVRFTFALVTLPAAPAGRTTASPPHAPPFASSCPQENRTARYRWLYRSPSPDPPAPGPTWPRPPGTQTPNSAHAARTSRRPSPPGAAGAGPPPSPYSRRMPPP